MVKEKIEVGRRDRVIGFIWQQVLLLVSLFIMTFGVALCIRSGLGSSVISAIPYVLKLAGDSDRIIGLSTGEWTYVMNCIFVVLQILILRRKFEFVQLFQLLIGFFFGWLLDVNMAITEAFTVDTLMLQIVAQVVGCTVLGIGIAFEIRCGSVTMPGEGLPVALSRVNGKPFPKMKILVDISLVVIAVSLSYLYFGQWLWVVIGPGTLFAMIYVGAVVKMISVRIKWFDKVLCYRPGLKRYVYGLARFIKINSSEGQH